MGTGADISNAATAGSAPVPQPYIQPTAAPGLRGPAGMSPRQNYSRVNTGSPGEVDAGGFSQKSISPKVGSIMSNQISMATRPRALNDMLKAAMESSLSRVKVAEEAKRQLRNLGCDDEPCEAKTEKKASANGSDLSTEYVLKLAAATDYIADVLSKESASLGGPYTLTENHVEPGSGPGALPVGYTTPTGPGQVIHTNSGVAGNKPPMTISLQKVRSSEHGATQIENDDDRAPGTGDAPNSGSTKNAAPTDLLRKMAEEESKGKKPPVAQRVGNYLGKHAPGAGAVMGGVEGAALGGMGGGVIGNALGPRYTAPLALGGALLGGTTGAGLGYLGGQMAQGSVQGMNEAAASKSASAEAPIGMLRAMWKQAEDAINPARISAGISVPTPTTITGQAGPPASGKERVPATAAGVADLTRREAKSVPKSEMKALIDEPMMSAGKDTILQQVFTHTNESGAKISSAQQIKVAAAKALLRNLAGGAK